MNILIGRVNGMFHMDGINRKFNPDAENGEKKNSVLPRRQ